jgi:polyisoprenoid-binding protein YceI
MRLNCEGVNEMHNDQLNVGFVLKLVLYLILGSISSFAVAADWQVDLDKAHIRFKTAGIMKVDGEFQSFNTVIKGDALNPESMLTNVVIQAGSISTGSEFQDGILRGSSFFNVEKYPIVTFQSSSVTRIDRSHILMRGNLTMAGLTKAIEFTVSIGNALIDPIAKLVTINTSTDIVINRKDWGMTSYAAMVNKNIAVHIDFPLISSNVDSTSNSMTRATEH